MCLINMTRTVHNMPTFSAFSNGKSCFELPGQDPGLSLDDPPAAARVPDSEPEEVTTSLQFLEREWVYIGLLEELFST